MAAWAPLWGSEDAVLRRVLLAKDVDLIGSVDISPGAVKSRWPRHAAIYGFDFVQEFLRVVRRTAAGRKVVCEHENQGPQTAPFAFTAAGAFHAIGPCGACNPQPAHFVEFSIRSASA
jgi:hypothetical protein